MYRTVLTLAAASALGLLAPASDAAAATTTPPPTPATGAPSGPSLPIRAPHAHVHAYVSPVSVAAVPGALTGRLIGTQTTGA